MNRVWFLLWAVVTWQVAAWAFAPAPAVPVTQMPAGDGQAFGSNERYTLDARDDERHEAAEGAGDADRRSLHRGRTQAIHPRARSILLSAAEPDRALPGNPRRSPASMIAAQWSGPDDKRIDRLTQEAYSKGYLALAEFDNVARRMVAAVVKDERVIGKGCAG